VKIPFNSFLVALFLALAESFAGAQQPAKVPRIGYLGGSPSGSLILSSFRHGLRELGYIEGQNIILEWRPFSGGLSEYYNVAAELVRFKVDVIVAQGGTSIRAAMNATKTIPIVITFVGDAASEGFVASLEQPGGNVTGVSGLKTELGGKWLELVKETIPSVRKVAVLWNRRSEERFPTWKSVDQAARSLGIDLQWLEVGQHGWRGLQFGGSVSGLSDLLDHRFRSAIWDRAEAFIMLPGGVFFSGMPQIVDLGLRNRLPGISWREDFAEAGGLMSYGANRLEQSRRAAYMVDKILKGAKAAELPMERPTKFELVINLKTAKEIGVTIPPETLMWADRVIK
jgi:putative ABC transport system substrate-binding protein